MEDTFRIYWSERHRRSLKDLFKGRKPMDMGIIKQSFPSIKEASKYLSHVPAEAWTVGEHDSIFAIHGKITYAIADSSNLG